MLSIPASTSNHGAVKPPGAQEVVLSISVSKGTSEFTFLHQSVKHAIDCYGFLGPLFCFVFVLTLVSFLPSSGFRVSVDRSFCLNVPSFGFYIFLDWLAYVHLCLLTCVFLYLPELFTLLCCSFFCSIFVVHCLSSLASFFVALTVFQETRHRWSAGERSSTVTKIVRGLHATQELTSGCCFVAVSFYFIYVGCHLVFRRPIGRKDFGA